VTITDHTQSECFEIRASHNTLEQISMHDGMAIGVYIVRGSNNLILNCDAFRNWDSVSEGGTGGNVDGYGCHASKGHTNNVFRGCRAWYNSDDGFDLINSAEPVLIDHCWAFYNGYSDGFVSRGDGNGFKAGGYGSSALSRIPSPIPTNTVQFCLAVKNKQSGFYSNHHLGGSVWFNNSAYKNKRNFNMLNREGPTEEAYLNDVPGWGHKMRNNLGFQATYKELTDINKEACDVAYNYFDLNVEVNSADFLSLDETELLAPREIDGSLPNISFMHLNSGSDLMDKGEDIGFEYNGLSPDLGCFESENSAGMSDEELEVELCISSHPNPFTTSTQITFFLDQTSKVDISLYNLLGVKVRTVKQGVLSEGEKTIQLNRENLQADNYLLCAQIDQEIRICKVIAIQ
jgi:hypothetical protein